MRRMEYDKNLLFRLYQKKRSLRNEPIYLTFPIYERDLIDPFAICASNV